VPKLDNSPTINNPNINIDPGPGVILNPANPSATTPNNGTGLGAQYQNRGGFTGTTGNTGGGGGGGTLGGYGYTGVGVVPIVPVAPVVTTDTLPATTPTPAPTPAP
jgi:hypothetical protein